MTDRWVSFDCYGTLIDWRRGIRRELERLFGPHAAPHLLERFHELEPELQRETYRSYRDVLRLALVRLAEEQRQELVSGEASALADSLPRWPSFPEVAAALEEVHRRNWRIAILSNSDRDLIAASQRQLTVPFDLVVVAEDVGSYKPALGHWKRFFAESGAERRQHVHVGASEFHDIRPAVELGLTSVWVNRLGEAGQAEPTREIRDLTPLPEILEEITGT